MNVLVEILVDSTDGIVAAYRLFYTVIISALLIRYMTKKLFSQHLLLARSVIVATWITLTAFAVPDAHVTSFAEFMMVAETTAGFVFVVCLTYFVAYCLFLIAVGQLHYRQYQRAQRPKPNVIKIHH